MNSYDVRTAVVNTLVIAEAHLDTLQFDRVVDNVALSRYPQSIKWRGRFVAEVYETIARNQEKHNG
jgi:hypothetical protein